MNPEYASLFAKYDTTVFERGLNDLQICLSETQKEQFLLFYEHLTEKNKVMNLTAITAFEDVVIRHFLDSLTLVKILDPGENQNLIDLGTGAGFPGIPLKIIFPELKIVLADSLNKRVKFLKEETENLGLKKVTAVHARAEELGKDENYREAFDICVSRAVADLSVLSEYCLPLVRVGGFFVSYKSADSGEEIKRAERAIRILGGKIQEIKTFKLPETEIGRSLIKIRKIKKTPAAYPRKAGVPGKIPLK